LISVVFDESHKEQTMSEKTITFTYHSHSAMSLDVAGTHLLIDPFFSGNPLAKIGADKVAADYILLTHGHGDHVGDTMAIAKRTGATVIANFEIGIWIGNQGHDKVHSQHIGGGWNHPFGRVKMTPALHGSMLPDGSNGGMPGGFLLTLGDKTVYIAGDTALFSDMALIGRAGIDLAVLPIGDNYTMGPDDALEAVKLLRPKVVVPCHFNTWPLIAVDANQWAARVNGETDCKAVVLSAEQSYSL